MDRLGLPDVRGSEGLLAAILISSLGSGLFTPFSLLYFHVVVGLDLPTAGIVLSIAAAAGLPLAPSLGTVIDRFGARRAIFTAQVLQGLAFLSYLAVREAWQLAIAATIATVGLRLFWPAYMAVYQLSWTVANLVSPVLFALLFVRNPLFPWIVVALAALVAAAAIRVLEPRLPTRAVRVRRPASLEPDQSVTGRGVS